MASKNECRLRTDIRGADHRAQCLLLCNSLAEEWLRGTPLLTKGEEDDIVHKLCKEVVKEMRGKFARHRVRRECTAIADAYAKTADGMMDIQTESLIIKEKLANLCCVFFLVKASDDVADCVTELCWTTHGPSERLLARVERLSTRFFLTSTLAVTENSFGEKVVEARLTDDGRSLAFGLIETIKAQVSRMKAKIQAIRDFLAEEDLRFSVISETIERYEHEVREGMREPRRVLYNTESTGWEEMRAFLAEIGSETLEMVEAVPDYDEVPVDQAAYDRAAQSVRYASDFGSWFGYGVL